MIAAADAVLKMVDGSTKIVPGHGPLGDKAALTTYRDMMVTVRDRVQKLKTSGTYARRSGGGGPDEGPRRNLGQRVHGPQELPRYRLRHALKMIGRRRLTRIVCVGAAVAASVALEATAPDAVNVMSFNIRYGTADDGPNRWELRRQPMFDLLKTQDPDVLGLQEALHFQLDEILTALPAYRMVGVGRADGGHSGEYSPILYRASRLTVQRAATFWFSDTPDLIKSNTWGNAIERICTWALFADRQGRSFYVYNLHLDHVSQPSREKSVALLLHALRRARRSRRLW